MQNSSNKELDHSSGQSTSPCVVNCLPWWNSSGSQVPPSSLCMSLNTKVESPTQHYHNVKRLGLQLQDQDSSSTQSTGQSHRQATGVKGGTGSTQGQCILAQSGYYEPSGRPVEDHTKSVLLSGTTDLVIPHSQIDYGHSLARVPYPYADPYFGSLVAASGPHAIIHPHMLGMQPVRVPLPLEFEEDGPVFVNPKQYHGILRRRRSRAKLEAQNKLIKARKPYLHESRHLHAQKRARGSGGRFLNTKQLQQSSKNNTIDSALLQLGTLSNSEALLLSEHDGNTNSCSEVTSVSNNDSAFRQPGLQFSGFHSSDLNGSQHRVSAIR